MFLNHSGMSSYSDYPRCPNCNMRKFCTKRLENGDQELLVSIATRNCFFFIALPVSSNLQYLKWGRKGIVHIPVSISTYNVHLHRKHVQVYQCKLDRLCISSSSTWRAKKQQRPGSTPANNVKKISFGRTFWRLWNVEHNGYSFRTKDCPTWSPNLARYGPFKLSNSFNETNCYRDLFPLFHSFTVSVLLTTYCIYYLLYFLGFHMQFCRQVEHFRPHNSILLYYELGMTWFSNIMPVPLSLSLARFMLQLVIFHNTLLCFLGLCDLPVYKHHVQLS